MLRVALLGGLSLAWGDQPLPPIASTRARALFAYLVLNRHRLHRRTVLAGLFWPDVPEAQARQRLRQTLWHVARQVNSLPLGPYLLREEDLTGFNAALPHQVDVDEFDSLSQGDVTAMTQAVRLYRGPLLPGIYDDWALSEQERLHERWLALLERLGRAYQKQGELPAATETVRMLLRADFWHEPGAQLLMSLLAAQGRVGEALQVYLDLSARLQADLDAPPAPETAALYRQLRAAYPQALSSIPPLPPPCPPPAIRQSEMVLLESALHTARQGQGQLVLLTGPAGIGKTHLAQTVAGKAQQMGFWTLYARAVEPFGPPAPYSPLDQVLRTALETLANLPAGLSPLARTALSSLLPDLLPATPGLDATRLAPAHFHTALAAALATLADLGPLLLVLDDLHWADPATWAVLRALLSRLAGCPLALIAAFRPTDLPPDVASWPERLAAHSAAHSLSLHPLSQEEIGQLAAQLLGQALPPALVARLHRETGGNPLFAVETVHGLIEKVGLHPDSTGQLTWPPEEALPIPATLNQAIAARLGYLTPQAARLLCQAAILEDDFDFDLLWALNSAMDEESLLARLEELLSRGLLVEEGERYRFAHNLVRRVLYDEIHPRRRRMWHRAASHALARLTPQQVAARARHAHAAEEWPEALELALAAADQALALFAVEEAQAFYRLAEEAEGHLEDVDSASRLQRLRGLARVYRVRNEDEAEARALEEWQTVAHFLGDAAAEALALATLGDNLCRRGHSATALPLVREAVQLASQNPQALATALSALGTCHEALGDLGTALQFYRQAVDAASQAGASQQEAECLNNLAIALEKSGRVEEATEAYRRAAALAAACGDRLTESRVLNNLATIHVLRGDYGPARRAYEDVLAAVKALEIREGQALVQGNLAEMWMLMGHLDTAHTYLEATLELIVQFDWPVEHAKALLNLAGWAVAAGNPRQALEFLEQARQVLPQQELQEQHLYYHYQSANTYLTLGDVAAAAEHATRLAQLFRQAGMDWLEGQVATLEGRVAAAQGDLETAEQALRRAVQVCEAQGFRADAANARAELGLVLQRSGQETEAVEVLAAAWEELARRMLRLDLSRLLERLDHPPPLLGQQEVHLPRLDAPLRRQPTPEECIAILWTPDAGPLEPPLRRTPLRRARLRRLLTEAIVQQAAPTIHDLAHALTVSPATLNTDLSALRQEGWPVFTRGYTSDA